MNKSFTMEEILKSFVAENGKTVKVEIADNDFKTLKNGGYSLCFAKKVGDEAYNVVWKAEADYLKNNKFTWVPMYQIFGSNVFEASVTVEVSTELRDIKLGQQCVLSKIGSLEAAKTGGESNALNFINQFMPIHVGVSQVHMEGATMVATPIYLSKEPVVIGSAALKPVEKVLIWFEKNVQTSTMFNNITSAHCEVDLTLDSEASVLYEDGCWKTI